MSDDGSCDNCKFWEHITGTFPNVTIGKCRRYAPTPIAPADIAEVYSGKVSLRPRRTWPTVNGDEWCGEHQYKPLEET